MLEKQEETEKTSFNQNQADTKPLLESELGSKKFERRKARTKVIFMRPFSFLYRCVKEDATEITLMLFFYLLDSLASHVFPIVILRVSVEPVGIAVVPNVFLFSF